jgi:glyceraldehyde 3-phosphate dehydrogenase
MVRVAINGFGRIGRMFFRAAQKDPKIKIVGINDLSDNKLLAHLLQYDSVHGKFPQKVSFNKNNIKVGKLSIPVFAKKNPEELPWKELKVDVVIESTGFFRNPSDANKHIIAGAKKVIVSAPCKCDKVCGVKYKMVVVGVNHKTYNKKTTNIISNASCTTNSVAPVLTVIKKQFGIKSCFFSTIHGYTSSQKVVDGPHKDLRRARAAGVNIIPASTGADVATVEIIPSLKGKIRGVAYRVPIPDGSITDFVIETVKPVTVEKVNNAIKKAATKELKGVLQYSEDELVSRDIIGNKHSSIFDAKLTKILGKKTLKIAAWYDNEWGYSCRLVDLAKIV